MKENAIIHERGDYFVIRERKGYCVYRNNNTHSVRCGTYALSELRESLRRAIEDCDRRGA